MIRINRPRRGFTLSQLVVGSAVVAFLLGLFFPSVVKTREAANRSVCQNNLKQSLIAVHNYASANRDHVPPLMDYGPGQGAGWMPFWFTLLPYLEQEALYKRAFNTGAGWNNNNHEAVVKVLLCPSDISHKGGLCVSGAEGWAGTSYAPVYQMFGSVHLYDKDRKVYLTFGKYTIANLPDGTSNQIGLVERFTSFPNHGWSNATLYPMDFTYFGMNPYGSVYGYWGLGTPQTSAMKDGPNAANPYRPNSAHATSQVGRMDGSVMSVPRNANAKNWGYLCTPDDGNVVTDF